MRKHSINPSKKPVALQPQLSSERASAIWPWLSLVLVIVLTGFARWRLLDMPLERDEGEFAYIAQQLLDGVPPYQSGYAMKMPGIYAAYAVSMAVFGESIRGIHLGAAVVNLTVIGLIFLVARILRGPYFAAIAAAMYGLLTLDPIVESVGQAEHFVLLPALLGVLVLQAAYGYKERSYASSLSVLVLAGFCLGLAPMIKQHGFVYCLFGLWIVVYQWWNEPQRRPLTLAVRVTALALGGILPFILICAAMFWSGAFEQFWFWTIRYSRMYAGYVPWGEGLRRLLEKCGEFWQSSPLIWSSALVGLSALFWDPPSKSVRWFVLPLLLISFLGACPGLYFRAHYFVYALPAVAMLAALGCYATVRLIQRMLRRGLAPEHPLDGMLVASAVIAFSVLWHEEYLFRASPADAVRIVYKRNPFPEAIEIARYIAAHSRETGPIMVLGSEPQIYLYANRRAASPHIYMYPLMEIHPFALKMQHELAEEVEKSKPEWIVSELYNAAWSWQSNSERWIFDWVGKILDRDYELEGVVDVMTLKHTVYVWGPDARNYQRKSNVTLSVFRRKSAAQKPAVAQAPHASP